MKLFLAIFCLFSSIILLAQEPITFSGFIAEDGSGLDKLKKYQEMPADKKEVYTTHDTVSDICDQVELASVLLNESVMKKVRKLDCLEKPSAVVGIL